jgi:hypothetical protein
LIGEVAEPSVEPRRTDERGHAATVSIWILTGKGAGRALGRLAPGQVSIYTRT